MATKEPKDKKDSKETLITDVKTPIKFKFVEGRLVLYLPSIDIKYYYTLVQLRVPGFTDIKAVAAWWQGGG